MSAVELLATGQATAGVDLLRQQDRIREIADLPERIRTIALCGVANKHRNCVS